MTTRLTIITPSFNQAGFLERTLRSVLDQGYEDLEYFVVDGGSTDGSVDIIRRYEDRLAWWVSEPDGGQTDALNKALTARDGRRHRLHQLRRRLSAGRLRPGGVGARGGSRRPLGRRRLPVRGDRRLHDRGLAAGAAKGPALLVAVGAMGGAAALDLLAALGVR